MSTTIEIWTDGGCRPTNPGHGAYSFVVTDKTKEIIYEQSEYCGETTNNIMELTASIRALEWCKLNGHSDKTIYLYTDSQYVQVGITSWIDKWKKRNWKTGSKKSVANQELWVRLAELKEEMSVNFHWIRGHIGVSGNERADQLCSETIESELKKLSEDVKNEDQKADGDLQQGLERKGD